uniref:Putative ovule protein n=1 Tax=Solanum chacoense TaxID=4108 RepID=A0A0V0H1S4_SOLCH
MQETEAAITSHTVSPHQDTDWIISMPKLVSPEIETSSSLSLYVHFINSQHRKTHTQKKDRDLRAYMLNPFWFFQFLLFLKQGLLVVL